MNDRILNAPLQFYDEHFSPAAQDLLRGLLCREPTKRLGYGAADADHIMRHPFFASVNWDDLYNRRVTPCFRPHLASATDTRYFDPQFTSQTPKDSYVESHLSELEQRQFNGFTFMATQASVDKDSAQLHNEWRQKARRTKSLRRRAGTDRISSSMGAVAAANDTRNASASGARSANNAVDASHQAQQFLDKHF
jgi:serine/threonine protein kinase